MSKLLIVVDMQNDFIDGSLGSVHAQAIVQNVKNKIEQYKANEDMIVFTRDTHQENYLETQEGKNLPVKHCIEKTNGWQIADYLCANETGCYFNRAIFDKDTFGSPVLAEDISYRAKQIAISEIELVGLCTDICVVSNALLLKAFMPEVKISVNASCCAGTTEDAHEAALLVMKSCQINIIKD